MDRRIEDIAESRLAGMQTMREFMDRRLTPARSTCEWAARRQDALSQRVSRISNLLRTRVEIEQQQSSQDLLTAMNQRQAHAAQAAVDGRGLSVAAITYYIVGLISYVAKAGACGGLAVQRREQRGSRDSGRGAGGLAADAPPAPRTRCDAG